MPFIDLGVCGNRLAMRLDEGFSQTIIHTVRDNIAKVFFGSPRDDIVILSCAVVHMLHGIEGGQTDDAEWG